GSAFTPGDITLDATKRPHIGLTIIGNLSPVLGGNYQASITLTGAWISGGTVKITATGASATTWDDPGPYWDQITQQLLGYIQNFPDLGLSAISPISGQVKVMLASATVNVTDTLITGSGAVTVKADATSDASFEAAAIDAVITKASAETHTLVVVGYGQAEATGKVTFAGQSWIKAGGTVLVKSNAETEADVSTAAHANTKIAQPDDQCDVGLATRDNPCVEYAFSIAIAVTKETAHTTIGKQTLIQSAHGNVSLLANGKAATSAGAETAVYLDGNLGVAIGVGVDIADIKSSVAGTIVAQNPTTLFEFDAGAAGIVSVADNTITISVPESLKLTRGQLVTYKAGASPPIGGLVDGHAYVIEKVEDVSSAEVDDETFVTQKVRLAYGVTLDLDATQVNPLSTHTIEKVALVTFPSAAVQDDGNGELEISGLSGTFTTGMKVRYLGPSSSTWIDVEKGSFVRDAAGDRIVITTGTPWNLQPIYPAEEIQVKGGVNDGLIVHAGSVSADGLTLFLLEANYVTAATDVAISIQTQPTAAKPINNTNTDLGLVVGKTYDVVMDGAFLKLVDPDNPGACPGAGCVAFVNSGVGVHGFAYTLAAKAFTAKTAVDSSADTITIASHGLQTGDLVIYTTDHTRSSTVQLYGFTGPDPTTAYAIGGPSEIPDAPIDGLRSASAYFVVVVDANHIRLVPTKLAAIRALPIDLTTGSTGTHAFSIAGHGSGVMVEATLEAENGASSGVELSDGAQSWVSVTEDALGGDLSNIAALARNAKTFATAFQDAGKAMFGPVLAEED
ncbi:MAG TPA: hypothetical protein VFM38_01200, partial [Candidatus Limnocylindrales bacterium]|nr:hypothetical protein [Candidatus Limnocylindrales bacterium]